MHIARHEKLTYWVGSATFIPFNCLNHSGLYSIPGPCSIPCHSWSIFCLLLLTARWYRGLVVTVERYQSEVFFLDHGDTEWVPNNMVQPIDPSLLNVSGWLSLPPYVTIFCGLLCTHFQHLLLSFGNKVCKLVSALEHHSLDSMSIH